MTINELIAVAREMGASDIHLTVGGTTAIRVNGELEPYGNMDGLTVNRLIRSMLTADQEKNLADGDDLDFCFETEDGFRQRVNIYRQNGRLAACIRLLNSTIPSISELKLPQVINELAAKKRGLVLVTGPTGSGKSTTLAAIIDHINKNRSCHVITIEDPIEYKYRPGKATIHQREIGRDVTDFRQALKSALREDPDVILVGEMRDYETISLAVTAAETGHLVLATLHTSGAAQTIDRIIDACPPHIQEQMRSQLANMIQGIVCQSLLPSVNGGRVAAFEIMLGTDAIKNLIRTNKVPQMYSTIQQSTRMGMTTLNDYIVRLYKRGFISYETAMEYSSDKTEMEKLLTASAGF